MDYGQSPFSQLQLPRAHGERHHIAGHRCSPNIHSRQVGPLAPFFRFSVHSYLPSLIFSFPTSQHIKRGCLCQKSKMFRPTQESSLDVLRRRCSRGEWASLLNWWRALSTLLSSLSHKLFHWYLIKWATFRLFEMFSLQSLISTSPFRELDCFPATFLFLFWYEVWHEINNFCHFRISNLAMSTYSALASSISHYLGLMEGMK